MLDESATAVDARGVPKGRQDCVDGDPSCDFESIPGACRFHVFACLGGADTRLGCAAAGVTGIELVQPRASNASPARDTLIAAFAEIPLPRVRARSACAGSTSTWRQGRRARC